MRSKTLTDPFTVRLEVAQKQSLEAEAKRLCIPFQELLRQRLDITAAVQGPLDTMRSELVYALGQRERAGAGVAASGPSGIVTDALLVELVLAMRQVLSPAQRRDVKNDVISLGLEPWTGQEPS